MLTGVPAFGFTRERWADCRESGPVRGLAILKTL